MAVVFSYSSDTNTIHVTGGTASVPGIFSSMYVADTSAAWGKVREVATNSAYLLSSNLIVGNGTAATHFYTSGEGIYFIDGCVPTVKNNATFKIGSLVTSPKQPSWIRVKPTSTWTLIDTNDTAAYLYLYGSTINAAPSGTCNTFIKDGTVTFWDTLWYGGYPGNASNVVFDTNIDSLILRNAIFYNVNRCQVNMAAGSIDISGIFVTHGGDGSITCNTNDMVFSKVDFSSGAANSIDIRSVCAGAIYFTNPKQNLNTNKLYIEQNGAEIYERYDFNVYVADQLGMALQGVTVKLFNIVAPGSEEISSDTDANGNITSNIAIYRKWVGTGVGGASNQIDFSPHTITLSKNGYRTITIRGLTLNKMSNFKFEMADDGGQTIGSDIIISMN
jgi:hypothetical protein